MSAKSRTQDCPICLDVMSVADISYPTLCTCGYNFCLECIEHMIETSKHPKEMASDGNMAVKVQIMCPQCRSDLNDSIHDTLILRRVETFKKLIDKADSELTASELRQKHSLGMEQITTVLEDAQAKYNKFSLVRKSSSDSEEGVEVTQSGDEKEEEKIKESRPFHQKVVDTSLFPGLNYSMTDEEQSYVTALMTSGEVSQLAQAAHILNGIAELTRQGLTPSMRQTRNSRPKSDGNTSRRPSDIENLVNVRMSPRSRRKHSHNTSTISGKSFRTTRSSSGAVGRALAMGRTEKDRIEQRRILQLEQAKRAHPLPVRMPQYITLDQHNLVGLSPDDRKFPVHFMDDEWDGTIADAFSKVYIRGNATVTRKESENTEGVSNVLRTNTGDDCSSAVISEPKKRVIISKVRGEAGRQGAQCGDVVTHFNGEIWEGDAAQLRAEISAYLEREDHVDVNFVLNAEPSTAEALKLRGFILSMIA